MSRSPDDGHDPDDGTSIDAAFDAIVANIDQPGTTSSATPWPSAENRDTEPPAPGPADPTPQRTPRAEWSEWDDIRIPEPEPVAATDDAELNDADEGHYVPPPPPPLPRGDAIARWAWAGAVGAPVLAIVLPLLGWDLDGLTGLVLVAAFLGGFGTLVSRLRQGPRIDDGPDDGAIV